METQKIVRLLPVDEALIVSPEVLAEFVKENFDKKHDTLLVDNIPDWEDVSQEKRDLLDEKLQAAIRKVITYSVDPDDLAARLAQIPSERGSPIRHMSPTASPEDTEFEPVATPQEYQARCYQALLEEGGRPLFHIDLLPQISANVQKYHDLLRPWRPYPDSVGPTDWEVFHTQIFRWQKFRVSQLRNRGRTLGFPEYLDQQRRHEQMLGGASKAIYGPDYEQKERSLWELEYGQRQPRRYDTDDEEKAAFLEYNNAMTDLLMDYGFTQPFQLHLDLEQQDQWTTFVEYLGFECLWLRRLGGSTKRMCPQPLAEQDKSVKAEVMAPSTAGVKSQNKQAYEPEETMAATENEKEMHIQTEKEEKQPETQTSWGLPDQGRYIPESILDDEARAAREREQRNQAAKARVIYQQCRVEWVLSEIAKIEAEQKSAGEDASLLGTKDCERKPTSDANMVTVIEECGRVDKEKMATRNNDSSSIAQNVKLSIPAEEVVPETQAKTSNKPPNKSHGLARSKKTSTQLRKKEGDIDLESAVAISAQVSSAATCDSQETCNDRRKTLRPRSNGKVATTTSKSVEANKKQTKE